MVGGTVIETIDTGDQIWINCQDTIHNNTSGIYVERTVITRSISEGDSIWWQGDHAYWTPKNKAFHDFRLTRTSSSGAHRPQLTIKA